MKRFVFCLIIFFLFINVKADDFGEWTVEKRNDLNFIVETERRYKYYNKEKVEGDYYLEDSNIDYPLVDRKDYKITDFTDWSIQEPLLVKNRKIEDKNIYYYSKPLKIRYIYLYNINPSILKIGEFSVFINGREINYLSNCNLCNADFYRHINDGDIFENYSHIEENGYFLIDLIGYVDIESIDISIGILDGDLIDKGYKLVFSREKEGPEYMYVLNKYNNIKKEFKYNYENMNVGNIEWEPKITTEEKVISSKVCKVDTIKYYRYQDILYKHYKEKINYSDYMSKPTEEYPYKDENKYQDYYRYKISELKETDIINKINELKELINNTNNIEEYNNLIEQINKYKIQLNKLNIEIEDYKTKIEQAKNNNKEIINKYENKIFNLKLSSKNNTVYDTPIKKNRDFKYSYLFIPLILVLIIFIIKKNKN